MATEYGGLLFIGDPHLASLTPGFRKDDFPQTSLGKLRHSLDYARQERLLPVILGDLFHVPRDNANWLLGDLITLLGAQEVVGIHGNHDTKENVLLDHDSFWFFADLRGNEADSGLPGILCLSRTQTWEARCLWMRVWPGWADGKGARSGRWNGSRPE